MLGVFLSHCCPTLGLHNQLLAQPFATCVSGWAGSGDELPVVILCREFINGFFSFPFLRVVHLNRYKVSSESWEQYLALDLPEGSPRPPGKVHPGRIRAESPTFGKFSFLPDGWPCGSVLAQPGGSRADCLKPSHPLYSEVISEVEMRPTHQVDENFQYLRD